MDFPISIISLALLTIFFVYKYILTPIFLSPLSRIPTPSLLCHITSRLTQYLSWREQELDRLVQSHRRYGPLIRTAPNAVNVSSMEGLRQVYVSLEKNDFYNQFTSYNGTPNLFSTPDRQRHSAQKRILSGVYSKSYLQRSEDMRIISETILDERLMPILEHHSDEKKPINVFHLFESLGIDFQSAYAFGLDISTRRLLHHDEAKFNHANDTSPIWKSVSRRQEELWFPEDECLALCRTAAKTIDEKRTPQSTAPIVFEKMYTELLKTAPVTQASEENILLHCASELRDQLIAAQEGLAITLTYVFYHLSKSPSLQDRLREELATVPSPSSSDLEDLPFLNALLTETLRLHAPGAGRQPRLSPPGGMTLHGYYIPPNTSISSSSYVLHRTESVFPDPETFQPERWLTDDGKTAEMKRLYWAFGSGGRMCIGNHFALMIMRGVLGRVFGRGKGLRTWVVDEEGVEQTKTFLAGPRGRRLILGLGRVERGE